MIKVDNCAEKRIFYLKEHADKKEFKQLKTNIINTIKNKEYKKLFKFKKMIML